MGEVYLYILTFAWGNQNFYRTPMPSWDACQQVVEQSQGHLSDGAENEAGAVLFCGSEKLEWRNGAGHQWRGTEAEDE